MIHLRLLTKVAKLKAKWLDGVFFGIVDRTDELIMGTPDGAVKARSFKLKAGDQAYDFEVLIPGRLVRAHLKFSIQHAVSNNLASLKIFNTHDEHLPVNLSMSALQVFGISSSVKDSTLK